jgi:hypothetical protein
MSQGSVSDSSDRDNNRRKYRILVFVGLAFLGIAAILYSVGVVYCQCASVTNTAAFYFLAFSLFFCLLYMLLVSQSRSSGNWCQLS